MILPQPSSLTAAINVLRAARSHTFHAADAALEPFPFDDMASLQANVRGLLQSAELDPDGFRPVDPVCFHRMLHLLSLGYARLLARLDQQATLRQFFDGYTGLVLSEVLRNAHRDKSNQWPDLDFETVSRYFVRYTAHWAKAAENLSEPALEAERAARTIEYLSQCGVFISFIAYYMTSIAPVTVALPGGVPAATYLDQLLDETR